MTEKAVLRHLHAIAGGRPGEPVPHRVLRHRGLDDDGCLTGRLARLRGLGLVLSVGRGRNRCHRLTAAGKIAVED